MTLSPFDLACSLLWLLTKNLSDRAAVESALESLLRV